MKRSLMSRIWAWLSLAFTGKGALNEMATDVKETMSDLIRQTTGRAKKYQRRGKMLWNSRLGTYRRGTPKIGRNVPCPCGKMRVAPRDVTRRNKHKWCCGAAK